MIGPIDFQELVGRDNFFAGLADGLGLPPEISPRQLRAGFRGKDALILIDELDYARTTGITDADMTWFRSLINGNNGLRAVVVSQRPFGELFNSGAGSEAANIFVPMGLTGMKPDEARELLAHPWASAARGIPTDAVEKILAVADGHPYKLQRAGFHCFESIIEPGYDWQAQYRDEMSITL